MTLRKEIEENIKSFYHPEEYVNPMIATSICPLIKERLEKNRFRSDLHLEEDIDNLIKELL